MFDHPESGPQLLDTGEHHYVEGQLNGRLIVSIPQTEPTATAEYVRERAESEFGLPVTVITHNVTLMQAIRLPPNEAAAIIKAGEGHAEAEVESSGD